MCGNPPASVSALFVLRALGVLDRPAHALEQLLARNKRLRDTEASTINMQLVTWREARVANEAFAKEIQKIRTAQ